jgi:hypothetical protein
LEVQSVDEGIILKRNIKGIWWINPLKAELSPICHLLALLGAHPILHVSGIKVNLIHNMEKWHVLLNTVINLRVL